MNSSPSIEELDQKYENCWRVSHIKCQWYSRRIVIVREFQRKVKAIGGYEANIATVVEELEVERQRSGTLLYKVINVLKAEEKNRKTREEA